MPAAQAARSQMPARSQTPAHSQMRVPMQAPAAPRATASALSRPQPAVQPAEKPAAQPVTQPAPPPPPPPAQFKRSYLSAYARDFHLNADGGKKHPLPLELQRGEGGMGIAGGVVTVPEDGYYLAMWELGVAGAQGGPTLQLGINDAVSQLTYALHPGYDSGQQVTWLNKGDKVGLFLQAGEDRAEADCGSAQFTVIRLG